MIQDDTLYFKNLSEKNRDLVEVGILTTLQT